MEDIYMYNRRFTPERITRLAENEIFVFGSNLEGCHGGGAAWVAMKKFGAVWGQGVGLQGQSYAIPTMQGGVESIKHYVDEFIAFAKLHSELTFLVTRIGCGIAGFDDTEIGPLFSEAIDMRNIILPKEFVEVILAQSASIDVKDKIRGSLMAGAAGDALGYTVEFMSRQAILSHYGTKGITQFELDRSSKALVSDDTQMTLFTANGMLMGLTRGYMRGIGGAPENYVDGAYLDWYYTQTGKKREVLVDDFHYTWLRDLPELAHRRAPGNTCISACESLFRHKEVRNNSKGCGGIMRVAPMGLLQAGYLHRKENCYSAQELAKAGAEIARVTHKHPLGFLPAALLTHLLCNLVPLSVSEARDRFIDIVEDGIKIMNDIYKDEYLEAKAFLAQLTRKAVQLALSEIPDADAIRQLGEGWTAEETWAIALFCALRHIDSPQDTIIAAVNHDGDSDSTGSVAGNIIGAIHGYKALKEQRLFCPSEKELEETLELSNLILTLADDLYTGCIISEYDPIDTPEKRQWYERYCEMKPVGI